MRSEFTHIAPCDKFSIRVTFRTKMIHPPGGKLYLCGVGFAIASEYWEE